MSKRQFKLFCVLFVTLICSRAYAHEMTLLNSPLPKRLTLSASAGTNVFGMGDALLPVIGNLQQMIFADVTGKYGDDHAWLVSAGVGGRKILNDFAIVGGYVFADFNRTADGSQFPVLNPGLEVMTNQWDGHVNGYLPVGNREKTLTRLTSTQLGFPGFYRDGIPYENIYDIREVVGPGLEVEVGYTSAQFYFLHRPRIFAGGYFFMPKRVKTIRGVEAGIELRFNRYVTLEFRDSFDNIQLNTALITLSFTFGGLKKLEIPTISDRMLDRIPRHFADLSIGDGIPSERSGKNTHHSVPYPGWTHLSNDFLPCRECGEI